MRTGETAVGSGVIGDKAEGKEGYEGSADSSEDFVAVLFDNGHGMENKKEKSRINKMIINLIKLSKLIGEIEGGKILLGLKSQICELIFELLIID